MSQGDVNFDQMTIGSMALIENGGDDPIFPQSCFKLKIGRNLSGNLSLVKVIQREVTPERKLVFQFYSPRTFTTKSSRFMNEECASTMDSFSEKWRPHHYVCPTDADVAGITVVSWDVDEGDVPLPASEYRKAVKELTWLHQNRKDFEADGDGDGD